MELGLLSPELLKIVQFKQFVELISQKLDKQAAAKAKLIFNKSPW